MSDNGQELMGFGHPGIEEILSDLNSEYDDNSQTITELKACGDEIIGQLRHVLDALTNNRMNVVAERLHAVLKSLSQFSEEEINRSKPLVSIGWRRVYTDSRLLLSLIDLCFGPSQEMMELIQGDPNAQDRFWLEAVGRLDMAIIVAGAPGDGRLDMIHDLISFIQNEHIPIEDNFLEASPSAPNWGQGIRPSPPLQSPARSVEPIRRLTNPPSLAAFRSVSCNAPFILPKYAAHWDSLTCHPWSSMAYLLHIAGRGRLVPVEVGKDYRDAEWKPAYMDWEEFLSRIGFEHPEYRYLELFHKPLGVKKDNENQPMVYLAQYNLLSQFPALRYDVIVPDYVYSSPSAPSFFPTYVPPANDEKFVLNAWLGPAGATSPPHTDPYHNFYAQIVGRKTVWLAHPRFQKEMYPMSPESSLSNTSQVDVFSYLSTKDLADISTEEFPLFYSEVLQNSFSATLEQGDLLFIPPGWWHAMRSEERSFSVSMWF